VANSALRARPTLANIATPGRYGSTEGAARVFATARENLEIACVIGRRGAAASLSERVRTHYGFTPVDGPYRSGSGELSALGIGPGRWLFVRDGGKAGLSRDLAVVVAPLASVSDHSDGHAIFAVGGPCARQTLAKGVPLDLHPTAFATDHVAVTVIAHIGAMVWRSDDEQFHIAIFRSHARSFWHWLSASAAEFGLDLI
jgi:sarcosine oxidase subunit gamma